MAENLHVAAFQGSSSEESNLSKMKEQLHKVSAVGAELLIFPELFLSGYCVLGEKMKMVAEERDGPSFQELSKTARESNIAVLYGYAEVDRSNGNSVYYNSAQLIDRDGTSLVNYRKTHLWICQNGYEEIFQAGDSLGEVVKCCNVKIGVLIGFDIEFPECSRTLALNGAEFIVAPTAISRRHPTDMQEKFSTLVIPTRASENCVHIVCVNHGGDDFSGQSTCCDPNGDLVTQAGCGEHLLFFKITPSAPVEIDYVSNRRPQLYALQ